MSFKHIYITTHVKRSKLKTILVEEILEKYHENNPVILHMYTQNLNDGFNAIFTKILQILHILQNNAHQNFNTKRSRHSFDDVILGIRAYTKLEREMTFYFTP